LATAIAPVLAADAHATWDFLVGWQRGKTAASTCALIDALPAMPKSCGCDLASPPT
jgi:hypothetical protein